MIPFKINQPVKTNDGRIGRILFYTDYKIAKGDHEPDPTSAVVLFVNKWSSKYPFVDEDKKPTLEVISRDEYDEAVKAEKKAVQEIMANLVAVESRA
jgi:hypothetical protein